MATYNQPCINCGAMIERDSRYCPKCASKSPFGTQCPACLRVIKRGDALCSGCGRQLMIPCPFCSAMTFCADPNCGACGKSVVLKCENKRCNEFQFFENTRCTVCGKPIKDGRKRLLKGK